MHKYRIEVRCIPRSVSRSEILKYFQAFSHNATFSFDKDTPGSPPNTRNGHIYLTQFKEMKQIISSKHYLAGSFLECIQAANESPSVAPPSNLKLRRIFLRNVKRPIDDNMLREFFSKFGEVESAYIVKSNKNGLSRGFGYVTFKQVGPAAELLAQGKTQILDHEVNIYPFQKLNTSSKGVLKSQSESKPETSQTTSLKDIITGPRIELFLQAHDNQAEHIDRQKEGEKIESGSEPATFGKLRLSETSDSKTSLLVMDTNYLGFAAPLLRHTSANLVFRIQGSHQQGKLCHSFGSHYLIKRSL
jgi:RNA recognition motif. (a.k.a. RRM, RBD, or RNP domain)